ncbi:hypothetical protein AA0483_1091 [Acetobacter syzygii NRIC 0483]|nr:hypothetical protein AA0483_1091 [Acetobacter syzygii NRIC 0483]
MIHLPVLYGARVAQTLTYFGDHKALGQDKSVSKTKFFCFMGLQAPKGGASRASPAQK